jgi:hypothetical protein
VTGAEYIGRVVEVARKHSATVRETVSGANIVCPGGALVEVYISSHRSRDGVVHEPGIALRDARWGDLECLLDIKRLVQSMPVVVDGPAPTFAPAASPSGFGSGAIDDTKGT